MFKGAALFLLLLCTASVFTFPFPQRQVLRRLAPQLRDPVHGETNAKRLERGLPLLPPARRWNAEASRTETAKRAQGSDTYHWHGKIQVNATNNGNLVGYLELGTNWYMVGLESNADTFSAAFHRYGISHSVSFQSDSKTLSAHPYLAGLIDRGVALGGGKASSAFLGSSVQTQSNDPPQSDGAVSVPGQYYETAFWDYDPTTQNLTPKWVDVDNNTLTLTVVCEKWYGDKKIYLTADAHGVMIAHRYSQNVTLSAV